MIAAALAYWQVFGLKKQARVAGHPLYRRARAARMFEGVFSRIIPWRGGALGATPRFRRAFAARSLLFSRQNGGSGRHPGPPPIVARTTAWSIGRRISLHDGLSACVQAIRDAVRSYFT